MILSRVIEHVRGQHCRSVRAAFQFAALSIMPRQVDMNIEWLEALKPFALPQLPRQREQLVEVPLSLILGRTLAHFEIDGVDGISR